jgi:hypothetical protein
MEELPTPHARLDMTASTLPALPFPGPHVTDGPTSKRPLVGVVLGALAGALVGVAIAKFGIFSLPKLSLGPVAKVLFVLVVLVTLSLVTLAHELGHLVGGWIAGYEFNLLIWGPFKLWREQGRLHLGRNRSWSLAGGMALSVPRGTESDNRHAALMVAGGPVASLLLGTVLLLLARPTGALPDAGVVRNLFGVLALGAGFTSLAVGVICLVPMRTSGFLTDGARLLRLARGGDTAVRDRAMMTLVGLATSSVRPRDWPDAVVRDVDATRDGSPLDAAAPLLAYLQALDRGELAVAHARLSRVAESLCVLPPAARGSYDTEMAFYELVVRGDAASAAAWLARTKDSPFEDRLVRPLVERMLRLHSGDAAAGAEVRASLAELRRRSGVDRMRVELIEAAMERADRFAAAEAASRPACR